MSEQQKSAEKGQAPVKAPENPAAAAPVAPRRMDPVRKWVLIFSGFCLFLLAWYLIGDRFTPFTTQARINAFVVPVVPQVAGEIVAVAVTTNQQVKKGQLLAQIDPERYQLAVAAAEAQLALTVQSLKVSASTVDAATAGVEAAKANLTKQTDNDLRLRRIDLDTPGAISQRRLQEAVTSRTEAEAHVASTKANLQKAIEALGPRTDQNPQLIAARVALDKAKLDLKYTRIVAPGDGKVTDLRVDGGNFAATGQPLMTFIAAQHIWVEANLTENNLGRIKSGNEVDLVLDVWPGNILRGHVRNVTDGVVAAESTSKPGGLPTVQNARDWLRSAQRFPVVIDFDDPAEVAELGGRVGSQVSVTVYTGDHPILNWLGRLTMRLAMLLSYAY
ncbi:MAG: HlyD family secretion protein [Azonexus sp.]